MPKQEIIEHVARTLFVCAFADACDDEEIDFDPRGQKAGSQENWFDTVTDPTPESAILKAKEIVTNFELQNERDVGNAVTEWAELHFAKKGYITREIAEEKFGYYLAMEALGHGVSLWDDVCQPEDSRFEVGYFEYGFWEFA
jgi:hypothetical protein